MFHNSQSNANSDDKLIFQRILKLNLTFRMLINIHFQERPLWIPNQATGITLVNYYHLSFRSQLPLVLSVLGKLCGLLQVKVLGVKFCLCGLPPFGCGVISLPFTLWCLSESIFGVVSVSSTEHVTDSAILIPMFSCYVSLKSLLFEMFLGQMIFKVVNYSDVFMFTCFISGRKLIEAFYLAASCPSRFKLQK